MKDSIPLAQVIKPTLTTDEAAFYLNRTPQTLRLWACSQNGPMHPFRVGNKLEWGTDAVKLLTGVDTTDI